MNANKVTLEIRVEVLHIDSVHALLCELAEALENETAEGMIRKDDGDEIAWTRKIEAVTF